LLLLVLLFQAAGAASGAFETDGTVFGGAQGPGGGGVKVHSEPLCRVCRPASGSSGRKESGDSFLSGLTPCSLRGRAGQLLLGAVLLGRGLDQRADDLLIGLQPVGGPDELLAVPGVHAGPVGAQVVGAAGGDRAHHALEAQAVELGLRQVQVLVAPAGLLAGHDLALADTSPGRRDAFGGQHRAHHTAHVEHAAHFFLRPGALALGVHLVEDVLDDLRLGLGAVLHHHRAVALGGFADVLQIRLGTRPPGAEHLLARVTGGHGLLDRGGGHHAPGLHDDVVRALLTHLQPDGLLLDAGSRHRQQLQVEAMHLRALLHDRQQLLAEGLSW
jgi:hypothetical protein